MDVMFQRHAGVTESGRHLAMLTFAPPSVAPTVAQSVAAWIGSLAAAFSTSFNPTVGLQARQQSFAGTAGACATAGSDQWVDETGPCIARSGDAAGGVTYWPCDLLNAFILQMAAHGHCVSAAMMLGHRPYAVQQLAAAQQMPDEALRGVAAQLQAYFDVPPETASQQWVVA